MTDPELTRRSSRPPSGLKVLLACGHRRTLEALERLCREDGHVVTACDSNLSLRRRLHDAAVGAENVDAALIDLRYGDLAEELLIDDARAIDGRLPIAVIARPGTGAASQAASCVLESAFPSEGVRSFLRSVLRAKQLGPAHCSSWSRVRPA